MIILQYTRRPEFDATGLVRIVTSARIQLNRAELAGNTTLPFPDLPHGYRRDSFHLEENPHTSEVSFRIVDVEDVTNVAPDETPDTPIIVGG